MKPNRILDAFLSAIIMALLFACQSEMSEQLENTSSIPATKAALVKTAVHVETAGTFAAELEKQVPGGLKSVQDLTISGKFDAEDVGNLRKMAPQLEVLDISNIVFEVSAKKYKSYYSEYQVETNSISSYMFYQMTQLSKILLPNSIVAIKEGAFCYCSALSEIEIPEAVISLGTRSFSTCSSLPSIVIPNSVLSIGENAFEGCLKLEKVQLSESLQTINDYVFENCPSLLSIVIPNSVLSIGGSAFNGCTKLKTIQLSENLKTIKQYAFQSCSNLLSIVIPNSVLSIGDGTFRYCTNLADVRLPEELVRIEYNLFFGANLRHIDIPNSVIAIGGSSFSGNALEEIVLPDKLQTIGECAFSSNNGLKTLTIPASVTSVGQGIVRDCHSMISIFWHSTAAVLDFRGGGYSGSENCLLYLFSENVDADKKITNVIVNGVAQNIVLKESAPYYCPSAYKVKKISFTRDFRKTTEPGKSLGWYTLALPFDVQKIEYNKKSIAPFAKKEENAKSFWLREFTASGYTDGIDIRKNQPYIIAMPNSSSYDNEYNISGEVTFSAESVEGIDMGVTSEFPIIKGAEYSMTGTYETIAKRVSIYPINAAGDAFERSIRDVSPFEAYVINNELPASARSFSIGNGNAGTRALHPLSRKPSNDDM